MPSTSDDREKGAVTGWSIKGIICDWKFGAGSVDSSCHSLSSFEIYDSKSALGTGAWPIGVDEVDKVGGQAGACVISMEFGEDGGSSWGIAASNGTLELENLCASDILFVVRSTAKRGKLSWEIDGIGWALERISDSREIEVTADARGAWANVCPIEVLFPPSRSVSFGSNLSSSSLFSFFRRQILQHFLQKNKS